MSRRWALDGSPLEGEAVLDGRQVRVHGEGGEETIWRFRILAEGEALLEREGEIARVAYARDGDELWVHHEGRAWRLSAHVEGAAGAAATGDAVTAPMTGTLLSILVEPGDAVEAGQEIGVLEAMKMQCELEAPRDGVVAEVRFAPGDQVPGGGIVVLFEPEGETS